MSEGQALPEEKDSGIPIEKLEEIYKKATGESSAPKLPPPPEPINPYCPFLRSPCNPNCMAYHEGKCVIVEYYLKAYFG
jgi:hypothetical protein